MDSPRREVQVQLDDMKFSAAHFVAFPGFREPLHGHNYTAGCRAGGQMQADGYVIDFGVLKKAVRGVCKKLNNRTLLPARSDVMTIRQADPDHLEITCEGNLRMLLPAADCMVLPIMHTTAEELSEYIWEEIMRSAGGAELRQRGADWLEVSVSERVGQSASYRAAVSSFGSSKARPSRPPPRPCLSAGPLSAQSAEEETQPSVVNTQMVVEPPPLPEVPWTRARARPQLSEDVSPSAEAGFRQVLNATLGLEEASRPELRKTPFRAAKAFREMTCGCGQDPLEAVGEGIFEVEGARDLVAVRDIPFHSLCEHHLLPFSGTAHIAYLP
eukprot:CAMPEP_0115107400 /NCGR_PEP_ID=MMETSP0227-20121206/37293_1 /TAXON_ID=89957 /ORGANISM="Polarella glacialis, Strain CCMP 1383" /LENGTH=327 /DNA_ID=CAMNT_0002505311 /DNA_START=80 /DNA_END=1060 /DNA_ORIENTATION=-